MVGVPGFDAEADAAAPPSEERRDMATGKDEPGLELTLRISSAMGVDFVREAIVYLEDMDGTAGFGVSSRFYSAACC